MISFEEIKKIKEMYSKNKNIIKYLNKTSQKNSLESILYSYDLQSGSYTKKVKNSKQMEKNYEGLGKLISEIIVDNNIKSVLEAGVGEGNTLLNVINQTNSKKIKFFGCDISTSRLLYAQKILKNTKIFTSDIADIALPDNSMDVVYTSHAIEPNYGREKNIINELF